MGELTHQSACMLAELIRKKEVSSQEVAPPLSG